MNLHSETLRRALLTLPLLLASASIPTGPALALERDGYAMEILVDGVPLTEYTAREARYVEALKGREYSIRLRNLTGQRVAIALSVDGLNSIDARTTSVSDARKWVLGPFETITLDGWQTSSTTARRFVFTTEARSYGAWLGRTENLGVVAAAVFRERRPLPIVLGDDRWKEEAGREGERRAAPESRSAPDSGTAQEQSAPTAGERGSAARPLPPDDFAATGIGRETAHRVRQVYLDLEDAPAALMEVRYEYHDALVRLGVLPVDDQCEDSLARRERARGFSEPGFAPDPYRRHR